MDDSGLPPDLEALLLELRGARGAPPGRLLADLVPRLRQMARRHLPPRSPLRRGIDSEDLLQEGLVHLVAQVGRFRGRSWPEFLAFAQAILAQKAAQQARRQRARGGELDGPAALQGLAAQQATPSVDVGAAEDQRRLRGLVAELPAPYRAVLQLRLAGLDHLAIAARLAITPAAARQRLSRAVRMVQERW